MRAWILVFALLSLHALAQEDMDFFNLGIDDLNDLSVVSASLQEEPLREAPVPVTVITAEMIRKSGARNLSDLLVWFVPGMTHSQDHNEVNVAMRGIYGSSQQKFLILIEGHRLNTRAFSQASPDFSVGLDKIRQIEILRGPGSSLYGNVALTAVVNIILFKGNEIDGLEATVGSGNYGQASASLLFGKVFDGLDVLGWGSFYRAAGERIDVPPERDWIPSPPPPPRGGQAILDRYDEPPSFDLGLTLKAARWSLFAAYRQGKYSSPFSDGGITGQILDYHDYPTYDGVGIGLATTTLHLGAKTFFDLGQDARLELNAYLDRAHIVGGTVARPESQTIVYPTWHDSDFGLITQYLNAYTLGGRPGHLLAGLQIDLMRLEDSKIHTILPDGSTTDTMLMRTGDEGIYSGFVQIKQNLSEPLLLNAGVRYDYKERGDAGNLSNLEPRFALVYLASPTSDWKLSYASSFVDAPYFYRYNQLPSYRGGLNLTPEYLDALQLTNTTRWHENRHKLEVNIYHNELRDFVFRDTSVAIEDVDKPIYKNAGQLESIGLESTYEYIDTRCRLHGNATWQHALNAEDYGEADGHVFYVPSLTANLAADFKLPAPFGRSTWYNLTLRYLGQQRAPIVGRHPNPQLLDHRTAATTLVNTGIYLENLWQTSLNLDLRVFNLFDEDYEQGGSVQYPYPQAGRWWQVKLTCAF